MILNQYVVDTYGTCDYLPLFGLRNVLFLGTKSTMYRWVYWGLLFVCNFTSLHVGDVDFCDEVLVDFKVQAVDDAFGVGQLNVV